MKVFRGKLESACLSIHVSTCLFVSPSVYEIQVSVRGIKSHLVTALVLSALAFNLDKSEILSFGKGLKIVRDKQEKVKRFSERSGTVDFLFLWFCIVLPLLIIKQK